ncbi:MFS transporter [Alphaproteobacteria bacterium]|nr:MFS transporter [Alphaproteobacteria bacterium]
MASDPSDYLDKRALLGTYGVGLFSGGQWDMLGILIPLFAVFIGLDPSEIGLVVAARSILPVVFSIHGGVLMDRFGTRNAAFWLALATATLPLLYPISSIFGTLFLLQLFTGLNSTLAMASGQTLINQISAGDPKQLGRFSFVTRFGNFAGPVLIGFVWHHWGSWPAFLFIASWGFLTLSSVVLIPKPTKINQLKSTLEDEQTFAVIDLLPRWADYRDAMALACIPAVAFTLAITMLRNGPGAIQASFFVVYLNSVGIPGTTIGFLTGISELSVGLGSLAAGWFAARGKTHWLVIIFVGSAVFFICLTPIVASTFTLLLVATVARGFSQGVNQPLIYSILSRNVGAAHQGAAVGLRNTVNRLSNIIVPAFMGYAAEWWGIAASFAIIATLLIGGCFVIAWVIWWKRVFAA